MILYLVVPCYNEEEIILQSSGKLVSFLNQLIQEGQAAKESRILFVNDGSKDRTKELLEDICKKEELCSLINFSRNFGHQYAVLAGYHFAKDKCDACISIDADLQQDINAIYDFLEKYKAGNDVVYGVRNDRGTDGAFKKGTSQMFYKLMSHMGCNIIPNHADYRLLSKKALEELSQYEEGAVFLRGLIPSMGLKSDIVYFDVFERTAGTSKYTLKKMLTLAMDGITSFSYVPIMYILGVGFFSLLVGFILMILYALPGFSAIAWLILGAGFFFSGIVEICIWIVGLYAGRNYIESKNRPRYTIESVIHNDGGK